MLNSIYSLLMCVLHNITILHLSLLLCSGGRNQPMVGKYSVSIPSFEEVALPALRVGLPPTACHIKTEHLLQKGAEALMQRSPSLLVIDEIGKMELFSRKFEKEVRDLFDQPGVVVLGTVPLQSRHRSCSLVDQLMSRKDVRLFEVSYIILHPFFCAILCTYTHSQTCSCAFFVFCSVSVYMFVCWLSQTIATFNS